ncbi:hypothetical protein KI688_000758 [Linnemannia hyalina]|uniref:Uncharacterized protein n=1 Tax=Linnemannia hyalina TaxID=64524 RepID=A0A9P7Y587_9FUNG|nr:hypothetical protein KI688_000758 [Linnemannia hyalina]
MAWCPHLEDLRIDTNKSIMMDGPWFRPTDATRKTPPELRLKPTRLVSLVHVNVCVKHQDLQDLLEMFHASAKREPIRDAQMELQDFGPALLDVFSGRSNVIMSLEIVNEGWTSVGGLAPVPVCISTSPPPQGAQDRDHR